MGPKSGKREVLEGVTAVSQVRDSGGSTGSGEGVSRQHLLTDGMWGMREKKQRCFMDSGLLA